MTSPSFTTSWTAVNIITAAEPSTVTMPSHEPRESAPTPASAISAKMITSQPLFGPPNPSSDTGPAFRHVPNTPTIASTIAARQIQPRGRPKTRTGVGTGGSSAIADTPRC